MQGQMSQFGLINVSRNIIFLPFLFSLFTRLGARLSQTKVASRRFFKHAVRLFQYHALQIQRLLSVTKKENNSAPKECPGPPLSEDFQD